MNAGIQRARESWSSMKNRCLNPKNETFKYYGGRGITICERWINSSQNFIADMGPRDRGMTLERINNNGNYEPGNCRWATRTEQARNTRATRFITNSKGEKKCVGEWAEIGKKPRKVVDDRIRKLGWTLDQALSKPISLSSRSTNRFIEFDGERLTVTQWAAKISVSPECIWRRISKGMPVYRILRSGDMRLENMNSQRLIEYNGETLNVKQWAKKLGLKYTTLFGRLSRGDTFERAIRCAIAPAYQAGD